jgi:pimeloyl-ACP methyl ester carboxylesterase
MVAARDDRVVSPESVEKFHRHWPTSQLRWVPGGHVSMLLFEVEAMADAIAQTFES